LETCQTKKKAAYALLIFENMLFVTAFHQFSQEIAYELGKALNFQRFMS